MTTELLASITSRATSRAGVAVIGVDGHSAAGKSTFAHLLAEHAHASIVHGDDFYRVMPDVARAALSPSDGVALYYDWERMRDEVLVPLRDGLPATYRPYDWDHNVLSEQVVMIEPAGVVVVEGLFVSRPELDAFVDVTVVVETDEALRAERQAQRGDEDAWLRHWDDAERWFFEHVRAPEVYDFRVRGDGYGESSPSG